MKIDNYIYVLRLDLYNEWAWENGATNLICISYNIDTIVDKLKKYCNYELEEDNRRIIDDIGADIDILIETKKELLLQGYNCINISVYENEDDFDNGKDNGVFVVEKIKIED